MQNEEQPTELFNNNPPNPDSELPIEQSTNIDESPAISSDSTETPELNATPEPTAPSEPATEPAATQVEEKTTSQQIANQFFAQPTATATSSPAPASPVDRPYHKATVPLFLIVIIAICVGALFTVLTGLVPETIANLPNLFIDTIGNVTPVGTEDSGNNAPKEPDNVGTGGGSIKTPPADSGNTGSGNTGSGNTGGGSGGQKPGTGGGNTGSGNTGGGSGTGGNTGGGNTGSGNTGGGNTGGGNTGGDTPATPTQAEINNTLRLQLEDKYDFSLYYGDELGNYALGTYRPSHLTDDAQIYRKIRLLENAMAKYPNGFFNEMINNGSTLVIYIVDSIGDNIVGLTGTYSDGLAVILLGTDFGEDYYVTATHHEFMHYFDAYMKRRSSNTIDLSMSALNPTDFVYGDQSYNHVYMPMYGNASTAYFVSVYGKTSNLEDRATIFGELMTMQNCASFMNTGYPINEKAKLIANQIDQYYASVNSVNTEYWERCIQF